MIGQIPKAHRRKSLAILSDFEGELKIYEHIYNTLICVFTLNEPELSQNAGGNNLISSQAKNLSIINAANIKTEQKLAAHKEREIW